VCAQCAVHDDTAVWMEEQDIVLLRAGARLRPGPSSGPVRKRKQEQEAILLRPCGIAASAVRGLGGFLELVAMVGRRASVGKTQIRNKPPSKSHRYQR